MTELSTLSIRRAATVDISHVKECVQRSVDATYGGLWAPAPLPITGEWSRAWVAEDGPTIVGVAIVGQNRIEDLWVLPEAQGREIGHRLLLVAEAEIRSSGYGDAVLRVVESNARARAFYARHGWEELRCYPHETLPVRMVDMRKALDEQAYPPTASS